MDYIARRILALLPILFLIVENKEIEFARNECFVLFFQGVVICNGICQKENQLEMGVVVT